MKICVIMSTFNGEKYIDEQMYSILSQRFNGELEIFIRDDGSTDRTIENIKKYKEFKTGKIKLVEGTNVGASSSFLEAIRNAPPADFYAFCDQDDIWKDGKIGTATTAIQKCSMSTPILWVSNYSVVNNQLDILIECAMSKPVMDSVYVLFFNNVPGCVMVFNQALMQQIRKMQINRIRMHDILTLNVALITGEVLFESVPYVLYRQHENNVLGYGHKKINPISWIKDKLQLLIHKDSYDISEYAEQVLERYGEYIDLSTTEKYELIRDYKKTLRNKLLLLSRYYTRRGLGIDRSSISIRCKILFELI